MPEGIIQDPRQNQEESDFGIVRLVENNKLYKYQKQAESMTRFYLFGEVVETSDPGPEEREEVDSLIVHGWVNILGYWENQDRCPVYRRVIRPIPEPARKNAIRQAIKDDKMPSPFPAP